MPEYQTPEPINVSIEVSVGDVRITAGERDTTVVEVTPTDRARPLDVDAAERARVEFSGGSLLVKAVTKRFRSLGPNNHGGSVDVRIDLPAGSRVTGDASIAAFRCFGPLGDLRLKASVGDLQVDQATAASLVNSVGDIEVGHVTGDAHIRAGSGAVHVGRVDGSLSVANSNGPTRVGTVGGELKVKAANGEIEVRRAGAEVTAKTANGDLRVLSAGPGSVVAETGNGEVEIGVAEGVTAWLDLDTSFGVIRNDLDAGGGAPGPGEPVVQVKARSGHGDIVVRRAGAAGAAKALSAA